jgi:hypothetical protein
MEIKIDPRFDTMGQAINKIKRDLRINAPNPDPYNRADFEFSPLRQAEARAFGQQNINPQFGINRIPITSDVGRQEEVLNEIRRNDGFIKIAPTIPTLREELMAHDPPIFRRQPALEPINYKDPMNHPHIVPELPKITQPCFPTSPFEERRSFGNYN